MLYHRIHELCDGAEGGLMPEHAEVKAVGPPLTVAVVGTGTMGQPMAMQVIGGGHDVRVHDVQPGAVSALVEAGARSCPDAASAASGADVVLLSLPGPSEVVAAVTGERGVLDAPERPGTVVDLSTNDVATVRTLHERCAGAGVAFLDAPVSGGVVRARTGTLAVLVGGAAEHLAAVRPVLDCIGDPVVHVGPPGAGAIAKIVNNQLFLSAALAVQEAYVLAAALGMAPAEADAVIAVSSAAPFAALAPLLLGRRFDDVIFRLDIAAKDLALAAASAHDAGVDAPLTGAAAELYAAAVASGEGGRAFHATLRELERRAGIELPPLRRPRPRPDGEAAGR